MPATAQIVLAGIVGTVGEPEANERRVDGLGDVYALADVQGGWPPYLGPGMCQAAEFIDVILKQIGVDGADAQPKSLRFLSRGLPVVRLIPGDMQSNTGARAGQPLDHRGVRQLFV